MQVGIPARLVKTAIYLGDITPVHHIVALQHLHTHKVEIRSHHIELVAHTNHIRIGKISIQHRITIRSVTLIAPSLGIYFHKIRAHILINSRYMDIRELYVTGMTH